MSKRGESSLHYDRNAYRQYSHIITPPEDRTRFNRSDVPEHIFADSVTRDTYKSKVSKYAIEEEAFKGIKLRDTGEFAPKKIKLRDDVAKEVPVDKIIASEIARIFGIVPRNVANLMSKNRIVGTMDYVIIESRGRIRHDNRVVYPRKPVEDLAKKMEKL